MRRLIALAALILLPACTTVETYHNACVQAHGTIAAQVGCVKANVMADGTLRDDTLAQEYIRTGELLAQRVQNGKLSEEEAQLRFVQTLNKVRRDELRERAYQAEIDRNNRDMFPRETECEKRGGRLYCKSY